MVKKIYQIFLIFLVVGFSVYSQTISVFASTDSTEYYVGDYIHFKIQLEYDNSISLEFPSIKDSVKSLDFLKKNVPLVQKTDEKTTEVREFIFSKYDSAEVTIDPIAIGYKVGNETNLSYIETNPVDLVVRTLEVNTQADIQDVKAPIRIQLDWWLILLIALIIVGLIAGGYYGYKRFIKKKDDSAQKKIVIKIPPHKIAIKALMDLEEQKLWQQGRVKDYHSEITGIIRKYFEDRFNFLAMEMPSSEVLEKMKDLPGAQPVYDITQSFLSNADMVKFAKFKPMPSVNEEMMKQGYEIVNRTKENYQPAGAEEIQNV